MELKKKKEEEKSTVGTLWVRQKFGTGNYVEEFHFEQSDIFFLLLYL